MSDWASRRRRGLWLQVPISRSAFIPAAVEEGFEFHHAQADYVMMTCWLPNREHTLLKMAAQRAPNDGLAQQQRKDGTTTTTPTEPNTAVSSSLPPLEASMIPDYATHSLGIGCLVLNSKGECLVIQEKFAHPLLPDFWKLPGGAIDRGEEIPAAAEREVLEETGIAAQFHSLIGFRHLLNFRFGTGDLYFISVCTLKDESQSTPVPQPEEIAACKWWDLQEFLHFHSSRWFQDLIREPVLQEWHKLFPNATLPPPPSPERIAELQTMPPRADGKSWPHFQLPTPPSPGSSVGLEATKINSVVGKIVSNFYIVAPPNNKPTNATTASATATASATSSKL